MLFKRRKMKTSNNQKNCIELLVYNNNFKIVIKIMPIFNNFAAESYALKPVFTVTEK